ncbi:MAG TPA: CBS domain-containing protein [Bacteroidia bacterium]|jgi:CBS domain-containing protein|nr:CBS domain-containing protein [Bacteroidia bacterium]
MKKVKEMMIDTPKDCEKSHSIQRVIAEMSKSNIGSLPVVDKDKKVIGVITDRDICVGLGKINKPLDELKVQEVMSTQAYTCTPEDDASTALKIMRTKKVGRLPVVDKEGRLQGVVSLNGIVRHHHENNEKVEEQYTGEENVMNTLHSIADRNHRYNYNFENIE